MDIHAKELNFFPSRIMFDFHTWSFSFTTHICECKTNKITKNLKNRDERKVLNIAKLFY